jgi:Anti-sigma regulatory factor (Ser/Thr protein kinase)
MKEMTVQAKLEHIRTVTDFVNGELEKTPCTEIARVQIDIAIDEIFGNIVRYAYKEEEGDVTVRTEIEGDPPIVSITFIDRGKQYDPRSAPEPDITSDALSRPIGGLGVFMVKKIMDNLDYEFRDGCNMLTIRKTIV